VDAGARRVRPYKGKRATKDPPAWSFLAIQSAESAQAGRPAQASLYKYTGTTFANDDTFWEFDHFDVLTHADTVRWMSNRVSPNPEQW
jgi:hypothetical protein